MPAPCGLREAINILSQTEIVSSTSPSSVDILAVVISIINSPPVASATSTRKVEIWITDESLAPGESAFVTLWGSSAVSRIEQENVSLGDIIRFNRVSLIKKRAQLSKEYSFVHSLENPEHGVSWFRFSSNDRSMHQRVPENMAMTSPQRIEGLKSFYQQDGYGQILLSPLRCKRRSLGEIQASVGILSNITVVVKSHESQISSPRGMKRGIKKRRRPPAVTQATIGYARVADASAPDVILTLVDLENKFSKILRLANSSGRLLMLTNVSSRKNSDVQVQNSALDEVVLVPTNASVALLISNESQSQSSVPQTLHNSTQTQIPYQGKINVVSSIVDISISGLPLQETGCMESPSSFLEKITTPDGKYRDALLHLESFGTAAAIPTYAIFASSKIMQTLCGGIEPEELIREEALSIGSFKLLQALLREQILLRWSIETGCEPAKVLKVVLPKT